MQDKSGFERTFRILLFMSIGLVAGVLTVLAFEKKNISFAIAIPALLAVVIAVYFSGYNARRQKKMLSPKEEAGDGSEVGFVVDTFHEVVAKLKEKEKELERLKSFAEEKAVRVEAYNENILQSVPSGVISTDRSGRIKSINRAAEKMLGLKAADAIEKDFRKIFREPLGSVINEVRPVLRREYQYVTDDKRHIWLGISTSRLRNETGEEIGSLFVFTDLTDIKALQEQLELKQRLSQLGEMSAGISHELRNSMSVISGYAKLLGKKIDTSGKKTVDEIISEISNMDRIISELLAFAKPSVLNLEMVDLRRILKETAESVLKEDGPVSVSEDIADSLIVRADEVLLRQALTNLLINALEAMPEGGTINIHLKSLNNRAVIVIEDTGSGIPEDILQKIFLPFFTTKEKGIGFGLALVQKIIVSHGGTIDVESTEGEGSSFRITLPLPE